jgi:hypothetical protein
MPRLRWTGGLAELAEKREHLAKADCDIAAGERRVGAQIRRVTRLHRNGSDTNEAELLLANLKGTLEAWRVRRDEILREIARLERHP